VYNRKGETLSEKSVLKDFPLLSTEDLSRGRQTGQLTVTRRFCHGNSYNLYIRSEVEYFASTVEPPAWKVAEVEAKRVKALKKNAPAALASVDAQLEELLKRKAELESLVVVAEKPKAKRGRPASSTVSTSRKKTKNNYASGDDSDAEADENNFSVGNVNADADADAESGSRRSGRTERKRYSDPGEDDDDDE